jgi:predicted secreted protein
MREYWMVALCLLVVVAIVCGCAAKKKQTNDINKTDDVKKKVEEPPLPSAVLDKDKELHVHVAEEFVILADGNITTGFSWFYCGKDTVDGVELKKNDYIHPKTNGITCGAPGMFQFVFEAKKAGRYELKFEYKRPWEKDVEPTVEKITVVVE